MSEPTPKVWFSPTGTPVVLDGVDGDKLAAIYAAEAAANEAEDGMDTRDAANALYDAMEAANLRTRHAWRCGYNNPRTNPTQEN